MKSSKHLPILLFVAFGLLIVTIFRPVPTPSSDAECLQTTGKVINIYEGGIKDVVLVLENSKQKFYINRGLEQGLDITELKKRLMSKEVSIKYPDYWSFFGGKTMTHLSKLELGQELIFSEY